MRWWGQIAGYKECSALNCGKLNRTALHEIYMRILENQRKIQHKAAEGNCWWHCSTFKCPTLHRNALQYCTIMHCTALHWTALHWNVFCTAALGCSRKLARPKFPSVLPRGWGRNHFGPTLSLEKGFGSKEMLQHNNTGDSKDNWTVSRRVQPMS